MPWQLKSLANAADLYHHEHDELALRCVRVTDHNVTIGQGNIQSQPDPYLHSLIGAPYNPVSAMLSEILPGTSVRSRCCLGSCFLPPPSWSLILPFPAFVSNFLAYIVSCLTNWIVQLQYNSLTRFTLFSLSVVSQDHALVLRIWLLIVYTI
jgi:hypothetical protein